MSEFQGSGLDGGGAGVVVVRVVDGEQHATAFGEAAIAGDSGGPGLRPGGGAIEEAATGFEGDGFGG